MTACRAQNSLTHEFQYWFLCNVLSPVQEARLELVARCVLTLACLLVLGPLV